MAHQTVFSKIIPRISHAASSTLFLLVPVLGCSDFSNEELVEGMCSNAMLNECHEHADCTADVDGNGYQCTCKEGWVGNGTLCKDRKECDDPSLHTCPANADCMENEPGEGYRCDCHSGYEDRDGLCLDIDQCADKSLNDCPEDTLCQNLEGQEEYACTWMVTEKTTCGDSESNGTDDCTIQVEDCCYSVLNDPSTTALYFNRCDDTKDFLMPDRGIDYGPDLSWEQQGGAASYSFEPARFDNGLKVRCWSRRVDESGHAAVAPFLIDKPDLSRGTVTFWGKAEGDMAGSVSQIPIYGEADRRVFVESSLWFYLTDQVYIELYGPAGKKKDTVVSLVVDGEPLDSVKLTDPGLAYFTLQWDTLSHFSDSSNVRLYIDGGEPISALSSTLAEGIESFDQRFVLKSITTEVGRENQSFRTGIEAENAGAYLDNVIIWNEVVPVGDLF